MAGDNAAPALRGGACPRFAVVMAGGSGTRFWPASRAARPKQFLPLGGDGVETLLQASVRRMGALVGVEQVLIVTSAQHAELVREQLPSLPAANVLLEPVGRNTAPCLAWAAAHVRRRAAKAVIAAVPADPHVGDEQAYVAALDRALSAAEAGPIATIGIVPTRPETGYGYLELGPEVGTGVRQVAAFVEKPTSERAERFLAGGNHLWNCGMFCFRADVLLRAIDQHLPPLGAFVRRADAAAERGAEAALVATEYAELEKISIDYGVMEKQSDIVVVPASFGWDDVGSWAAAFELATKDTEGNAGDAERLALDAQGCYVRAPAGKLVALLGVRDLVVVDTGDALLVLPRDRAQSVGKVIDALKAGGKDRFV
jgi:mannose-1-phosphate guanylyltransferase